MMSKYHAKVVKQLLIETDNIFTASLVKQIW